MSLDHEEMRLADEMNSAVSQYSAPFTGDEKEWLAFTEAMGEYANRFAKSSKEASFYVINEKRVGEMKTAFEILKSLTLESDPDATFECRTRELAQNIGEITIACSYLTVMTMNMPHFLTAINYADNFEIWPGTESDLHIHLSFIGITESA